MAIWEEWLLYDMNTPRKEDYYQMQTALEVRRTRLKDPSKAELKHMRLPFKRMTVRPKEDDEKNMKALIDADKEAMIQKLGGNATRIVISRKEYEERQRRAQEEYEERKRRKKNNEI